jgi:hypothetical protein
LKNNKVVISRGKEHDVFSAAERIVMDRRIASARMAGRKEALVNARRKPAVRRNINSNRETTIARKGPALRKPVTSAARRPAGTPAVRRPVVSARKPVAPRTPVRQPVNSAARRSIVSQRIVANNEAKLRQMHDNEERQKLFQNSQKQISEEKIQIKSSNTRNADTLNKMYSNMF